MMAERCGAGGVHSEGGSGRPCSSCRPGSSPLAEAAEGAAREPSRFLLMTHCRSRLLALLPLLLLLTGLLPAADPAPPKRTPKEALQAFNDLIGSWRCTGSPLQGSVAEKNRNFWVESAAWEWQFKGDAWLKLDIDKGKFFTGAELRYLPDSDRYRLTLHTVDKMTLTFEGALEARRLTLDRVDADRKEDQRLVLSLLHSNRYLLRYEVKPLAARTFTALWQIGATKEGVPFASGEDKPECIVSGGLGTIPVMYKGKTYYVCCSGCRDAFREEPEKYIREYEERKKKEK
jgi:hypothetical protein